MCELHFEDDCVQRNFSTLCKDGQLSVLERDRPRLIPGSIPTKFPNCPKYLSINVTKRKVPASRAVIPNKKLIVSCNFDAEADVTHPVEQENSYSNLDADNVKMPFNWIRTNTGDILLFIKMNSSYQCEHHVVINQDLAIRIRFLCIFHLCLSFID